MSNGILGKFIVAIVLLAVALLMTTTIATSAPVVIDSREAHAAILKAAITHEAAIRKLADQNDTDALLIKLEQFESDENIAPEVRDHLLELTLLEMSRTTPTPQLRAAAKAYSTQPVNTFLRLDEARHQLLVPLYDSAAAALLTLRIWDTAESTRIVSTSIRNSLWQPNDFLHPVADLSPAAWQAGTLRALQSVERSYLDSVKNALLHMPRESGDIDRAAVVVANRLGDVELYSEIIAHSDTRYALEAVTTMHELGSAEDAIALLTNAAANPHLASAAILKLGEFASNNGDVRRWLFNRLANPTDGASAALSLARIADADILSEISGILIGDDDELTRMRAALVLRLSESSQADTLRRELSTRNSLDRKFRQSLQ